MTNFKQTISVVSHDDEDNICKICFVNTDKVFLKCEHSLCGTCESKLERKICPFCRTNYSNFTSDNFSSTSDNSDLVLTFYDSSDEANSVIENLSNRTTTNNSTIDNTRIISSSHVNPSVFSSSIRNSDFDDEDEDVRVDLSRFVADQYINPNQEYFNRDGEPIWFATGRKVIKVNGNTILYFDTDNVFRHYSPREMLYNMNVDPTRWIQYRQYSKYYSEIGNSMTNRECYINYPGERMKDYEISSSVINDMCKRFNVSSDDQVKLLNSKYFVKKASTSIRYVKIWLWDKLYGSTLTIFHRNQNGLIQKIDYNIINILYDIKENQEYLFYKGICSHTEALHILE